MNKEELVNLSMKETILNKWKSKLSYPFTHKDLEELENIINYYEEENFNLREGIYIEKMSFSSEGRNFKELIEMPTYEQLQNNWNELKKWLKNEIYNIEPKRTAINYNCEYDSEEDYINAMKERSKLITLKRVLIMLQELERGNDEHTSD